jgi:hypothetical protein
LADLTVLTYFKIYTLQLICIKCMEACWLNNFIATVVALHGMLVLQELKFWSIITLYLNTDIVSTLVLPVPVLNRQ